MLCAVAAPILLTPPLMTTVALFLIAVIVMLSTPEIPR
jgi:hypothetical protein